MATLRALRQAAMLSARAAINLNANHTHLFWQVSDGETAYTHVRIPKRRMGQLRAERLTKDALARDHSLAAADAAWSRAREALEALRSADPKSGAEVTAEIIRLYSLSRQVER